MIEIPAVFLGLIIVFLLFLSGFFSGSETSLTGVSRAKIYRLKSEGNKRAKLVSDLRDDKDRLIGAILLGNNLVNIGASALATAFAIQYFGEEGVLYATVVMTLLVLIFAEVMPKTYAFRHTERVALLVSPVINIIVKLLSPITITVQHIVDRIFKVLGLDKPDQHVSDISGAEMLRGAILMHHDEGAVIKRDRDMLESILSLGETEVGEVMIHRKHMQAIDITMPTQDIVSTVLASSHSRFPLWKEDSDNIVGVLHVKDLVRELESKSGNVDKISIDAIMAEPWFVPDTTPLMNQLHAFREKQNHFSLVIDEYGSLLGLITLEDILEEIVGQIEDEFDTSKQAIRKEGDDSYVVEGAVTIRDLNRALDWNLPDDIATTLAGLVISKAQQIPMTGQIFQFYGYRFEVLKKQRNQITSIRAEKVIEEIEEEESVD